MAGNTTNIGLSKPDLDDFYDIGVFNENADIIDTEIQTITETKLDKTANAVSASKLQMARKINNVEFDGTQNITVKADPNSHEHPISDVTNLQTTLDGKAPTSHVHSADDLTSGTISYDRLKNATTTQQGITQLNDTLTSESTFQALAANQGRVLNENKLDKTANATSATKLYTARTINEVAFDGTQNITVKADPNSHEHRISDVINLQATLDGKALTSHKHNADDINAGTLAAARLPSHTHSAGDITSGTMAVDRLPSAGISTGQEGIVQLNNTLTSTSTTEALTANQGKVLNDNKLDKTANAVSATKLQTARTINGVAFDGTQNITITASGTPSAHTHPISDVTNLQTTLDGKAPTSHASISTNYGVSTASNYGHSKASATTPVVAGTASVGTDNGEYARGNHVHPAQTTITGNAGSATKLQTARTINGVAFDGTQNITISASGTPSAHTHPISDVTNLQTTLNGKAPTNHASSGTTYGVSTASNYGHAKASTTTPVVAGTASVGTDNGEYARGNHVHPAQTTITGNAGSATKLQTARTINGVAFDGTQNITISASGTPSAHTHPISDVTNLQTTLDGKAPTNHASSAATYGVSSANSYGHARASTATPEVAGNAIVGTDNGLYARGDHRHPAQTTITGNAGSATKLQTARTINGVAFDGTKNITIGSSFERLPAFDSGLWENMFMENGQVGTCRYFVDSDNFVHVRLIMTKVKAQSREVARGIPNQYGAGYPIVATCYIDEHNQYDPESGQIDTMVVTGNYLRFFSKDSPIAKNGWTSPFGDSYLSFYTFYRAG